MHGHGGVIFDLDGVLVDSRRAWHEVLNELLLEDGLEPVGAETFDASFGQSSAEDARRFFGGRVSTETLDVRYEAAFPRHLGSVTLVDPAAPRVLAALRRRGTRTAIATNAPGATSHGMLDVTGLTGAVETVVTPDDVERPKPAPDMLHLALSRLSLSPAAALFVGDSESDIGAGRAAGVFVVGFRVDGADHRVESFRELERLVAHGPRR